MLLAVPCSQEPLEHGCCWKFPRGGRPALHGCGYWARRFIRLSCSCGSLNHLLPTRGLSSSLSVCMRQPTCLTRRPPRTSCKNYLAWISYVSPWDTDICIYVHVHGDSFRGTTFPFCPTTWRTSKPSWMS